MLTSSSLLQGIALSGLPSSYVSGLSLYFIASQALPRVIPLFSYKRLKALSRGLTPLSSGGGSSAASDEGEGAIDNEEENARLAAMSSGQAMMMPGQPGGAAPGGWMAKAAFKAEAQALASTSWASALVAGERDMIAQGQAIVKARLAAAQAAAGSRGGKKAS